MRFNTTYINLRGILFERSLFGYSPNFNINVPLAYIRLK